MRLIHGDALDVLRTLGDLSAYALVADPPYGLGEKWRGGTREWPLADNGRGVKWDAKPIPWLADWVGCFGQAIVWGGHYYPLPPRRGWLIWDKVLRKFSSGHVEMAWTTLDQPTRAFNCHRGQGNKVHPAQKPLSLMRWCLSFLPLGMPVLDPFMGSGTTGVACAMEGRDFIGVEIQADHFAVAQKRIAEAQVTQETI